MSINEHDQHTGIDSVPSSGDNPTPPPTYPQPDTQKRIILDHLISANGGEVGVHELGKIARSAAPHSPISSLRTDYGWDIQNRRERVHRGNRVIIHSLYWLPLGQLPDIENPTPDKP